MSTDVFPLFRDYSIVIRDWLRATNKLPRLDRLVYNIQSMTRMGTTNGGVNQHEISLVPGQNHQLKVGHPIRLESTQRNDEYYMISVVAGDVLIIDQNYRKLVADQSVAQGTARRCINVVYASMDRSIAMIAQPLRNGTIDNPGIAFYVSDFQQVFEKSRPRENYYTRRYKDNNTGSIVRTAAVPPLQVYKLQYTINLWSVYQQEQDILQYQIVSEFAPQKFFWVGEANYGLNFLGDRYDREFHGQWAHTILDSVADNSDLEPGDAAQRALRTDISISVTDAYLPLGFAVNDPSKGEGKYIGSIDIETLVKDRLDSI